MRRRRRNLLITLAMLPMFGAIALAILAIMLKHRPAAYVALEMAPGPERQRLSDEFQERFYSLMNAGLNRQSVWGEEFTGEQINSYLQQGFVTSAGGDSNLPPGFHDARVGLTADRMTLSCRYGDGFWSTILSLDMRFWLVARETNLIALEIVGMKAGAVPLPTNSLLAYLTEQARRWNMDIAWYRRGNNPVAVLRFQADQAQPTIQLQRLELGENKVTVQGRFLGDPTKAVADESKPKPKPVVALKPAP